MNDIYRSPKFYDIKRGGGCEFRKQVFFTKAILHVLTVVFQYYVDCRGDTTFALNLVDISANYLDGLILNRFFFWRNQLPQMKFWRF